ncbi:MAG: hypothetical protein M1817_001465 [Caeruleum heppii]|nr:MAG: hypothetical protein M1817_001465 [Caeruleum heppii]
MADLLRPEQPAGGSMHGSSNGASIPSRSAPMQPQQPIPVPRVKTPRDIMRVREEREARRRAETEAREQEREDREKQRRLQEEKRRSTDRRSVAAGVAEGNLVVDEREDGARHRSSLTRAPQSTAAAMPGYEDDRRQSVRRSGGSPSRSGARAVSQPMPVTSGGREHDQPYLPRERQTTTTDTARAASGTTTRPRASTTSQPQPRSGQVTQPTDLPKTYLTNQPQSQATQTRPTTGAGQTARAQGGMSTARSASQRLAAIPASEGAQPRNTTTSSFPHAFERWETLSSHWEGLTSYWIRRLEQNSDEIKKEPLAQQMSRQITDLSAAGANLFHAVVELQRLRASSERKFQRWFFDTRAEQERAAETQAQLESALQRERQQRGDTASIMARAEKEKSTAEKRLDEMTRELQISKEEARRAWEELGRREQEEHERTKSLRDGQPTLVGGVQVVPMQGGLSRFSSVNRPTTSGQEPSSYSGQSETEAYSQSSVASPGEYNPSQQGPSATTSDPFVEIAQQSQQRPPRDESLHSDISGDVRTPTAEGPPPRSAARGDPRTSTRVTGSAGQQQPMPDARIPPQYSQAPAPAQSSNLPPFYQHEGSAIHSPGPAGAQEGDNQSYLSRPSDDATLSDEEYEIDEQGNFRLDPQGRRIVYRRGLASEESDDYDVREDLERERAHTARYGGTASGPTYPSTNAPTAPARAGVVSGGWSGGPADYSGTGYGSGWESLPRHHHPTRLSDVLEEDERSRTSPSRASANSRR